MTDNQDSVAQSAINDLTADMGDDEAADAIRESCPDMSEDEVRAWARGRRG